MLPRFILFPFFFVFRCVPNLALVLFFSFPFHLLYIFLSLFKTPLPGKAPPPLPPRLVFLYLSPIEPSFSRPAQPRSFLPKKTILFIPFLLFFLVQLRTSDRLSINNYRAFWSRYRSSTNGGTIS